MLHTSICALCLIGTVLVAGACQPTETRPGHKEIIYEGKQLSQWIAALRDKDITVSRNAEDVLRCLGRPAVPALCNALKDNDERLRRNAAAVLTLLETQAEAAVPALIEAVNDRSPRVRSQAASALREIGPKAKPAIPVLIEALKDEDPEVRVNAASALGRLDPDRTPAMVKRLIEALADKEVRNSVILELAFFGPSAKAAAAQLSDLLKKDPDRWVRAFAALTLAEVDPKSTTISLLIGALKDEDAIVRNYAAQGLHVIGPPASDAMNPLIELLQDEDKNVRSMAAWALGAIGSKAKPAVTSLTKALEDSAPEVRNSAATALALIDRAKAPSMVNKLLAALKDKDIEVRADAAFSLGEIGLPAKAALPQLIELSKDKPAVRLKARAAIKKIEPEKGDEREKK